MRHTGLAFIGDVPWGTHFCQFYETGQDLVETLVPYFMEGLKANEFCMWITSAPLQVNEAKAALGAVVPDLDERIHRGQIEIIDYKDWYIHSGKFSAPEVLQGWTDKLEAAQAAGYEGLRLSGNTFWLEKADWENFRDYEETIDSVIGRRPMIALCTYSLRKCGASEIIDVAANHEFALIKRRDRWEIIASAARKQAEEAAKKEALKYAKVLQTANAGFWLFAMDGRLLEVNDTYCRMSGYSREELLGLRVQDLEAKETAEDVRKHIRYVREHGHHQFETRHRRKDGSVFDAEVRASYLEIEDGRMVVFTWDITERKRLERAMRDSEARLRLLAETAGRLLEVDNPREAVQELCREAMEHLDCQVFFNFLADEAAGRLHLNAWAGIPAEEARRIEWLDYGVAVCGSVARDGARIVAEDIQATPDPRTELVRGYGVQAYACHPLLSHGRVIGTLSFGTRTRPRFGDDELAVMKTIADQAALAIERLRDRETLRDSEERYRHLIKHAPTAIYEVDFQAQRFGSVNDAMCEMLGYSREELLAMSAFDVLDEPGRELFRERIRRWLAGEKPDERVEYRVRAKDGREIYALLNVRFVVDENGRPAGATVIAHDITARRQMEEELRRTREHLGKLLDFANAPIIVWDPEFRVTLFNHAFERLTGLPSETVLGRPLDILFPDASRDESLAHIKRTLAGEQWETVEIPIRRTDGTVRTVLWNSANIFDKDGATITATIAQGQDITERKQAEEENRWVASFPRLNPQPVTEVDADGRICFANPAARRLFPDLEALGSKHPWLMDWPSLAGVFGRTEAVLPPRQVRVGDRWYHQTLYLVRETQRLRVYAFDITERVLAEEELRRHARELEAARLAATNEKNRLEALMEALPVGVAITDAGGGNILANSAYERVWGEPRPAAGSVDEYAAYQAWWSDSGVPLQPGDWASARVIRTGQPVLDQMLEIRRFDGRRANVINSAAPIFDARGKLVGSAVAIQDITELRRSEEALKRLTETLEQRVEARTAELAEANELLQAEVTHSHFVEAELMRLAAAVEQADQGMVITDKRGLIVYANPAFEAASGAAPGRLVGRLYPDLLAQQGADGALVTAVETTARQGGTWSGRAARPGPDGLSRELQISLSPIRDGSGQVINNLVVERDITRETRLQEQLRQAQKLEALGTLAGGIAHDFNNILNPIMINTELALLNSAMDAESRTGLEVVLKAAERGRDLVRQIIIFSRQQERERRPSRIGPVVREALKLLRTTIPETIEVREEIGPERGYIMADPSRVHQIVMNLCHNSAYALRERGGCLEVGLAEVEVDEETAARQPDLSPGPYLRLTVADTGSGMTPEVMERAFDPFFTTKKPGEGTGMGLAVVHGIVRDYQGAVAVSSEIGKGSIFSIYFPRLETREFEPGPAVEVRPQVRARILLVDDEESQIQSIRKMLKRLGHQVVSRTDSPAALRAFKKDPGRFDLLITDQIMPKLTGVELAEQVRRVRPDLPVILCTGYSDKLDDEVDKGGRVSRLLLKPFSIREMTEAVNESLKKS